MKELILSVVLLILSVMLIIGWNVYRFYECKKVGHSTFYCIMILGD